MYKNLFILLSAVLFLPSCSGYDGPESDGQDVDVPDGVFRIFSRADDTATPGDYSLPDYYGAPQSILDTEKINDWVVIFINNAGNRIEEVCSGDGNLTTSTGDESYSFNPDMPDGTYKIVAFANMKVEDVAKLVVGDADGISDFSGLEGMTASLSQSFSIPNNSYINGTDLIPMSGVREDVKIAGNNEVGDYARKNSIEVIRMVAKIELKFYNSTSNPIDISNITFGSLQTEAVILKPDYNSLDSKVMASTVGVKSDSPENCSVVRNPVTIPAGASRDLIFYVRESDASLTNPATGRFMFTLDMGENGVAGSDGESNKLETRHYAVTEDLAWINRNDHVVIPVKIEDYIIDWRVVYYPPIGGYPAVLEDKDPHNFYYFCDFKTPGEFQVIPEIKDSKGNPITFGYTLTVGDVSSDGDGFFTVEPKVTLNGDEITGAVGTALGNAVVPVTISFEKAGQNAPATRTRNIYIRRS